MGSFSLCFSLCLRLCLGCSHLLCLCYAYALVARKKNVCCRLKKVVVKWVECGSTFSYFELEQHWSLALLLIFHRTHNLSSNKFVQVARQVEGFCISTLLNTQLVYKTVESDFHSVIALAQKRHSGFISHNLVNLWRYFRGVATFGRSFTFGSLR